jgi:hypothetical protein
MLDEVIDYLLLLALGQPQYVARLKVNYVRGEPVTVVELELVYGKVAGLTLRLL